MAALVEGMHTGEFIGEHPMDIGYHVDEVTVASSNTLKAGTVTGALVTATPGEEGAPDTPGSGKEVKFNPNGSGGAEIVAGIAFAAVDASSADAVGRVVKRGPMTVNLNDLDFPAGSEDAVVAGLLAIGIKAV